jgi:hypothetical protein
MTREDRGASSFDELAVGLSRGTLSRGKALRLMGAALVGGTLASFGIGGIAAADQGDQGENEECKPLNKKCRKNEQCCSNNCFGGICRPVCRNPPDCTDSSDCCPGSFCDAKAGSLGRCVSLGGP